MLERQRGGVISFECDGCGDVLDTGERDFVEAKSQLDSEAWTARESPPGSRVWQHYCQTCTRRAAWA